MNRYTYGMHVSKIGDDVFCYHCKLPIGSYVNNHGRTNALRQCPRCGWDQIENKYEPCKCNSPFCQTHRANVIDMEENADPNGYVHS